MKKLEINADWPMDDRLVALLLDSPAFFALPERTQLHLLKMMAARQRYGELWEDARWLHNKTNVSSPIDVDSLSRGSWIRRSTAIDSGLPSDALGNALLFSDSVSNREVKERSANPSRTGPFAGIAKRVRTRLTVYDAPKGFKRWWKIYPVHKEGPAAVRVWVRRGYEDCADEIIDATQKQLDARAAAKKRGDFYPAFPYPKRFLERERFTDEIEKPEGAADDWRSRYTEEELAEIYKRLRAGDLSALPEELRK